MKIIRFFDKLEDRVRGALSRIPIVYAILSGVLVILFGRSVWMIADELMNSGTVMQIIFSSPIQLVLSIAGLLITGLAVSIFIGDHLIMSGLRHEKKIEEMTRELVHEEEVTLLGVRDEIRELRREIKSLKEGSVRL